MEPITLLINRTDMVPYAQTAIHAREENTIQPYILAAQNIDIKPALGAAFWYDILTNQHTTANALLIDGGAYTDANGHLVTFQGIKAALACYTYARYVMGKNMVDTPYGMVTKTTDFSQPVPADQLTPIASEKRNEANCYLRECIVFLDNNTGDYPLWLNGSSRNTQPKFIHRITPVTRWQ